ncbi:MAG: HPr family phosphocarrier protein [Planctomycetes bacterium]|nr:HPr family phosphocarrier protein [Planctomycetota bacterium]
MTTRQVTLTNRYGLHARPASKFVTIAHQFHSDVRVSKDGRDVNGKSIMEIMLLAAEPGSILEIRAEGPDAEAAVSALTGLVQRNFDEDAAVEG